jgi:A/G-specific adenine glycosylase
MHERSAKRRLPRTDDLSDPGAVIFDLDGTLIDSEPVYRRADEAWLASKGITVPESAWDDFVGVGGPALMEWLRDHHGLAGSIPELVAEKDVAYLEYARRHTRVFPPVRELILDLVIDGIPLAVVTSSRRSVLDAMLAETGLETVFAVSVASDDVRETKPHPEPYLLAARRLGVDSARCWVFEDSQYGVIAAHGAGMRAIAVPGPGLEVREAFRSAEVVVKGGPDQLNPADALGMMGFPAVPGAGTRLSSFRELVLGHYRRHGRPMPWRETDDPYHVLVSEFMLQQTQTDRVVPRYREFLERFPGVADLARSELADVLAVWSGLGYNRRARYLRDAAREIVTRFDGAVPPAVSDLVTLPGIGPYTAGAVRAFGFGLPAVFVETNIRRVFLQVFLQDQNDVPDREIMRLVGATLDHEDPRQWYYALMDYGAYLARTHGNANRRSAHYRKQAPFEGSVRQVRGSVVRCLTANGPLPVSELEKLCGRGDSRFEVAIEKLASEGMIVVEAGLARLA